MENAKFGVHICEFHELRHFNSFHKYVWIVTEYNKAYEVTLTGL